MENLSAADAEREAYVHNVEETLARIASHKGVMGFFVIHPDSGKVLRFSGFDSNPAEVKRYVDKLKGFIDLASSTIRTIDWKDNMTFLRMCFGPYDILVAPDLDRRYTLVVLQHIE